MHRNRNQYSLSEPAEALLADSSSSTSTSMSDVPKSSSSCTAFSVVPAGCHVLGSIASDGATITEGCGFDLGFTVFLEAFRAAGFRAVFAAVFFFATAFFAIGFVDLAFALGLDLVFAATFEVARFAVFFAADFAVFFAADFWVFFFPAGFAIPKLLLVALCSRYRVVRASTFLYSDMVFHYNQCGEPQNCDSDCDSLLYVTYCVLF
jgi:hypothetical protein